MKKLTQEIYETRFPNINYEYFDSLDNKEEYLNEYSTYVKLFLMYLIKNTSIKRMESEIRDCPDFKYKIPGSYPEDQDMYQYLCNEDLEYFYIRNNIYIERLTPKEKEYLDSIANSKDFKFDDKAEKFVKETVLKLIKDGTRTDTNDSYYINFGPSDDRYFYAFNDSIVIGARMYPGMPADDLEEFNKSYHKRMDYFSEKCEELEELLNKELNMKTKVIEYGDTSVKKITFDENKTL